MSGICGICRPGAWIDRGEVTAMLASLAVATSEAQESSSGTSIGLGISNGLGGQDLAVSATVSAVADCDLLNMEELRALVESAGKPALEGTAGILVSLYSLYGLDFIHKLDGAFALALWDEVAQRLVLAIDRVGIKNICWRQTRVGLTFATRISALQAIDPSVELNPAALAQYMLFSAIPAPMTVYRDTEKIRPGVMLILEKGQIKQKQYWDLEYHEERHAESKWSAAVRAELRASVHRHMPPTTEVERTGTFLSGGTDSSTVVAFMSERGRPVKTFSAIFNESAYSEAEFVRTVVERFGTEQHDCLLSPQDAMSAIPKISGYYDEPFANSSAIAAYCCSVTARQCGIYTLLGGDGGDELFAGNTRYATDKQFALYQRIPRVFRRLLIEPMAKLFPLDHKFLSLPRRYIQRASIPNPQRYFSYYFGLSFPEGEIFTQDFLEQVPRGEWLRIPEFHYACRENASELNRLLYIDLKMTLADNDLKKVSGMAELAGIQVRYPLLDYRLAELAARVPANLKLKRFEKRYIFKRAMSGILPDKILYKKKHGMGVPISVWLLSDPRLFAFAQDVLHDSRTKQRGYFHPDFTRRLMDLTRDHVGYYGEIVWYLLALELWHREHFDHTERQVCVG